MTNNTSGGKVGFSGGLDQDGMDEEEEEVEDFSADPTRGASAAQTSVAATVGGGGRKPKNTVITFQEVPALDDWADEPAAVLTHVSGVMCVEKKDQACS